MVSEFGRMCETSKVMRCSSSGDTRGISVSIQSELLDAVQYLVKCGIK